MLVSKRTEYGKKIRKDYEKGLIKESRHNMTKMVPRKDDISNTITTVTKDNLLCESVIPIVGVTNKNNENIIIGSTLTQEEKLYERTPLKFLNRNQKNIEGDYAFCIDSCNTGGIKEIQKNNIRIRKLTPKECWRLMGFKDESFEKAQKVNSNTQLYKQAGNSIVVNVLEKIIANMNLELEHIKLLELFGGIGACSEAMKNLGLDFEIADYVEIDKYAVASYNAIHNTNFEPQDITTWDKDIKVDFVMHGSPCQDFSLAGKQAGGDEGSGTRSSLMYETVRIVEKLRPKYVLWENVKNVIGSKHKHNFDKYLKYMEDLGYKNYYQVLNAKDYGIPQNRERVFTLSILGDGSYVFPPKQELKLKLKDMLEDNVNEKYYLSDEQVERIHKSTYNVSKTRIQEKEYCQTLCARDWKDPKCVRVGGIFDTDKETHQAGSIYDKNGLAPTLDTMQGGWRQPCIEEHKYDFSDLD